MAVVGGLAPAAAGSCGESSGAEAEPDIREQLRRYVSGVSPALDTTALRRALSDAHAPLEAAHRALTRCWGSPLSLFDSRAEGAALARGVPRWAVDAVRQAQLLTEESAAVGNLADAYDAQIGQAVREGRGLDRPALLRQLERCDALTVQLQAQLPVLRTAREAFDAPEHAPADSCERAATAQSMTDSASPGTVPAGEAPMAILEPAPRSRSQKGLLGKLGKVAGKAAKVGLHAAADVLVGVFVRQAYLVDNSALNAQTQALGFRRSKDIEDRCEDGAEWNTIVDGFEESGGWVRVGDRFLPLQIGGVTVLKLLEPQEARRLREERKAQEEHATVCPAEIPPDVPPVAGDCLEIAREAEGSADGAAVASEDSSRSPQTPKIARQVSSGSADGAARDSAVRRLRTQSSSESADGDSSRSPHTGRERRSPKTAGLRSYCHGRLMDGYLSGVPTKIEEILQDAVDEELAEQVALRGGEPATAPSLGGLASAPEPPGCRPASEGVTPPLAAGQAIGGVAPAASAPELPGSQPASGGVPAPPAAGQASLLLGGLVPAASAPEAPGSQPAGDGHSPPLAAEAEADPGAAVAEPKAPAPEQPQQHLRAEDYLAFSPFG